MDRTIGYIFGKLHSSEVAIRNMRRTFKNQVTFNKKITTVAVLMTAYVIVVMGLREQEQNDKIEKLSNEIKEIKQLEGE